MKKQLRRRLFSILDKVSSRDIASKSFNLFIIFMISLNAVCIILETVTPVFTKYRRWFFFFDNFSIAVFTIEYIARIVLCTSYGRYNHPLWGRLKYIFSIWAMVDLLSIAPYYILMFFPCNLKCASMFRILRFFRLLKLGRYSKSLRIIVRVLKLKIEELFVALFLMIILLIISSTMMYLFEHDAQPNVFSSIPASMWWGIATLTTICYGDIYPITLYGKIFAGIIAILGVGFFALPAGILVSGFAEELNIRKRRHHNVCPHCGKDIIPNKEEY